MLLRRNKQAEKYSQGVIQALQMRLWGTTSRFQEILSQRTEALQQQHETRQIFTGQVSAAALAVSPIILERGKDEEIVPLLVVPARNEEVIEQRAIAAHQIAAMIDELHKLIQQLNTLVSQHHELTIRIDANVEEARAYADETESAIRKYWRKMSSNRWLMVKIFAVVAVFVILFLVMYA